MFNPSREQVRDLFFDTWKHYREAGELTDLQKIVLAVLLRHPEYHDMLGDPDRHRTRDFTPEHGAMNPFLHLSLHLAIEEQRSIDQPPGIRAEYERLLRALGDAHDAEHVLLECLGETLWEAQRLGKAPDTQAYLECLRRRGGSG